jgi:hypothetical protein
MPLERVLGGCVEPTNGAGTKPTTLLTKTCGRSAASFRRAPGGATNVLVLGADSATQAPRVHSKPRKNGSKT